MYRQHAALFGCIFLALSGDAASAWADGEFAKAITGPVEARVTKVRDGDTVEVEAFIWPMQTVHVAVRLKGIDAPEHRGKCPAEKHAADVATNRLVALIGDDRVKLYEISGGKYYGRVLARIATDTEKDLSRTLLKEGLVAPYKGGKRRNWCDGSRPETFSEAASSVRERG
ncbi:thermonuclease family protein [Aurantimonas sp. VKM B-3413]|uniref:thermonuclease family protein n=1 Tax=Aurantimonas sp. VKM B-3413 TaxID=2779401 RepID=UPI001E63BF1F|nr:thermonuclease family protein [Aurantimonas sp. VKM B-3413]MCB8840653.1 thermonuclease family protein [Aurantimonas sp. VKM B-3413]